MQVDILSWDLHSKFVIAPGSLVPLEAITTCIYHDTTEYEMRQLEKQC